MTSKPKTLARELVSSKDPILRNVMPRFDFSNPPMNPLEICYILCDTLIEKGGVGLAANQIGLPYRVFAIKANPMLVCFNPIIVDKSSAHTLLDEGCLTYPGLFVKVKRADIIKVRYAEPNGQVKTTKFVGMTARIFQHELDHLDGKLFTDSVSSVALEMAIKKAKKRGHIYTMADFKNKKVTTDEREIKSQGPVFKFTI